MTKQDELRQKAEDLLKGRSNPLEITSDNVEELIYELQVYQMELELQNEELRETQIKLENSRKEYFSLYDISPIGYFTLNEQGIILNVNLTGATLLGLDRKQLYKKAFIQYIEPEYRNQFHHHLNKVKNDESNETLELKLVKKDDKSFNAKLETIKVPNNTDNFKEYRIVLSDITKQKDAEASLRDYNKNIHKMLNVEIDDHEKVEIELKKLIEKYKTSNEELQQFAHVSSHDLKEPLRMITSFLQLLKKRYSDDLDEDANDFINYAVDGAKRMDKMITDLLKYSEIGTKEVDYKWLKSEEILDLVLENLKLVIEESNTIITHDPLPLIYANKFMMIQLFQNIISNSIKYRSEESPEIHISVKNMDNSYLFSIADNGMGIDEIHLERIFNVFQRLHNRDEYEGTGIGLAIVKRIVQKHQGKIWVKSEIGKGTTFYFTIPNQNHF